MEYRAGMRVRVIGNSSGHLVEKSREGMIKVCSNMHIAYESRSKKVNVNFFGNKISGHRGENEWWIPVRDLQIISSDNEEIE